MKQILMMLTAVGAIAACADVVLTPSTTEVVVGPDAKKTTVFAAEEMRDFLSEAFGVQVPLVKAPTDGKASVVIGDNAWSRATGIDVTKLARDGYVIRTAANRIYIAGVDSNSDLRRGVADGNYWSCVRNEHASLFGVYDFLERFADCRFFFPGKYGTIVPKASAIRVYDADFTIEPHFTARNPYMGGDGRFFDEPTEKGREKSPGKCLHWLRLRMETENIPCCHGQNNFEIPARFIKDHPEYSQLRKDGLRNCELKHKNGWEGGQLCQTSGVWDEMYKDVASYFKGEGPEVRKMISRWDRTKYGWNTGFVNRKYVDCMPQDGMQECFCKTCQAAYDHSTPHYATELIWGNMAKMGNRLKAEGIPGTITQMSYLPYGQVPKVDLPDNILVIVAQNGPWQWRSEARAKQIDMYRQWAEKTHRRVQTWTYPHKYGNHRITGIPCIAPRIYGTYWKEAAPYVTGGFLESEAENSIYQYFNYYIFSRVAWNPKVNVEAVIADHHSRMFGKGAKAMAKVFDLFEEKWLKEIAGNIVNGPMGPVPKVPPIYEVWTRVYSSDVLAQITAWFDEAETAAADDAGALARVKYMRSHLLDVLIAEAKKYTDRISVETGKKAHAAPSKSVVPGGSLDSLDAWKVECAGTQLSIDPDVKVEGTGSLKIVCDKPGRHAAIQYLKGTLKPGTTYKLSFFMKLENVVAPKVHGGVYAEFCDGTTWIFEPKNPYMGTIDWVYHEALVTTSPQIMKPNDQLFHLAALDVTGTVWFDDVRLEEVP